jgi:hypothetical protein
MEMLVRIEALNWSMVHLVSTDPSAQELKWDNQKIQCSNGERFEKNISKFFNGNSNLPTALEGRCLVDFLDFPSSGSGSYWR